ncbi:hypothetical protein [uncultured Amnibacterium sp.]|uniref:hypothetical protein n=1 Tax=uncultured Amnibacterium sp. TaxID=1631851 RepID=UPI0035CA0548
MSDASELDLAASLTRLVVDIPGVRGIYPQSVVSAAVAGLVRSAWSAATGLLKVEQDGEVVRITARLAVDSERRSRDVIAGVQATLLAALPARPLELDIEIAHID